MRSMFRDASLQKKFDRDGYVVVDFLEPAQVSSLISLWQSAPNDLQAMPFSNTIMSRDAMYRRTVHEGVATVLRSRADALFDSYRMCLCSFLRKAPSAERSVVQLHQDWTFVDESRHRSAAIWCPLVDVDRQNGCLQVVPGSHQLNRGPRDFQEVFPYADLLPVIERDYLIDVPMKAGQALISVQTLFHSSPPNRGPNERVVAGGLCIPEESRLVFLVRDPRNHPDQLKVYEVGDDFYQNYTYGSMPDENNAVGLITSEHEPVSEERLHSILGRKHESTAVEHDDVCHSHANIQ